MPHQVKLAGIEPEVLEDVGVVAEVGKVFWAGKVTVTVTLFVGVDDCGLHHA